MLQRHLEYHWKQQCVYDNLKCLLSNTTRSYSLCLRVWSSIQHHQPILLIKIIYQKNTSLKQRFLKSIAQTRFSAESNHGAMSHFPSVIYRLFLFEESDGLVEWADLNVCVGTRCESLRDVTVHTQRSQQSLPVRYSDTTWKNTLLPTLNEMRKCLISKASRHVPTVTKLYCSIQYVNWTNITNMYIMYSCIFNINQHIHCYTTTMCMREKQTSQQNQLA